MRSLWPTVLKLGVYSVLTAVATALLAMVIVNSRTGPAVGFRAVFTDASGVTSGDNVKIAGVTVGKVTGVEVVNRGDARVSFTVDEDVVVPAEVSVEIKYENLIGDRYLELARPAGPVGEALPAGAEIPIDRTRPALNLTVLFGGFRPLFDALQPDQVNRFAEEVLATLQGQGGTVESLLARTASLTSTIADRDAVIGTLVDDLNSVLGTVAERDSQLSGLVVELQRFVSGLSDDRRAIGQAVVALDGLTTSVTGLLQDARPALREDIVALDGLATNLNRNEDLLDQQLKDIPVLLGRVNRTASYGSWFQFFLCDVGGAFTLPNGERATLTPYSNTASRCGR
ncbi:MCE family protein [Nocardioides sp.]|uniref:MCE family protein n=1 Tax=Nocardioides sp. TaxID=35761 RepID=UPI00351843A9